MSYYEKKHLLKFENEVITSMLRSAGVKVRAYNDNIKDKEAFNRNMIAYIQENQLQQIFFGLKEDLFFFHMTYLDFIEGDENVMPTIDFLQKVGFDKQGDYYVTKKFAEAIHPVLFQEVDEVELFCNQNMKQKALNFMQDTLSFWNLESLISVYNEMNERFYDVFGQEEFFQQIKRVVPHQTIALLNTKEELTIDTKIEDEIKTTLFQQLKKEYYHYLSNEKEISFVQDEKEKEKDIKKIVKRLVEVMIDPLKGDLSICERKHPNHSEYKKIIAKLTDQLKEVVVD